MSRRDFFYCVCTAQEDLKPCFTFALLQIPACSSLLMIEQMQHLVIFVAKEIWIAERSGFAICFVHTDILPVAAGLVTCCVHSTTSTAVTAEQ